MAWPEGPPVAPIETLLHTPGPPAQSPIHLPETPLREVLGLRKGICSLGHSPSGCFCYLLALSRRQVQGVLQSAGIPEEVHWGQGAKHSQGKLLEQDKQLQEVHKGEWS